MTVLPNTTAVQYAFKGSLLLFCTNPSWKIMGRAFIQGRGRHHAWCILIDFLSAAFHSKFILLLLMPIKSKNIQYCTKQSSCHLMFLHWCARCQLTFPFTMINYQDKESRVSSLLLRTTVIVPQRQQHRWMIYWITLVQTIASRIRRLTVLIFQWLNHKKKNHQYCK